MRDYKGEASDRALKGFLDRAGVVFEEPGERVAVVAVVALLGRGDRSAAAKM
jgi:hypothetical protein